MIYSGVGDLTKSDIAVASVQGAFVVAFNVGSNAAAMDEERRLSGAVRTNYYSVVYDVLEEIEGKLQKVLSPTPDGELVGTAVVKQCFDIGMPLRENQPIRLASDRLRARELPCARKEPFPHRQAREGRWLWGGNRMDPQEREHSRHARRRHYVSRAAAHAAFGQGRRGEN